ncbi:Chemotaxis protein CheY [Sphingobium herbicidovorans NBRC 16415]|uniref:Chemotaxis protein CheY n=1 Tax=Sphingobium herbicidovorans (strain ATCC 700291 / DSM 11019 / CCUG 56400 / KCTC 2939 / LMG 18315 / NBRC 16415 / MH) TaxID=1219045 RepID=A0A086PAL2_SPHHM|nr:response regulator [Sphingobium herbicidovorans]KFG90430.1 Chemotaxis protein CheY [Sphingobium herbicidovorans NBRC 16415]
MSCNHGRILLVEDDPALAGMIADLLQAQDYEVDGPYSNVSDGIAALASHFPDGAVVDLHRQTEGASLLKDDLAAYAIPFLDGEDRGKAPVERRLLPWLRHIRH